MTAPVDLIHLARRAEREAVLAVLADDARVAAIHQELSRRYSWRLLRGLGAPPPGG